MNAGVITATAAEAEVFSPRTRAAQVSESKTMAIAALAEKLRREGVDVIDLGASEPDFPTPSNIRRAAYVAMEAGQTKYTATSGTADFKQALRDRFAQDFGARYETAGVMAASGARQIIFNAISTLIEPDDEVLIAKPYWVKGN